MADRATASARRTDLARFAQLLAETRPATGGLGRAAGPSRRTASASIICGSQPPFDIEDGFGASSLPRAGSSRMTPQVTSTGCGVRLHPSCSNGGGGDRLWVAAADSFVGPVVPLQTTYFSESNRGSLKLDVSKRCGCRSEGVGCAICGNALGALVTPCGAHSTAEARRPGAPAAIARPHYIFLPSAVSAIPAGVRNALAERGAAAAPAPTPASASATPTIRATSPSWFASPNLIPPVPLQRDFVMPPPDPEYVAGSLSSEEEELLEAFGLSHLLQPSRPQEMLPREGMADRALEPVPMRRQGARQGRARSSSPPIPPLHLTMREVVVDDSDASSSEAEFSAELTEDEEGGEMDMDLDVDEPPSPVDPPRRLPRHWDAILRRGASRRDLDSQTQTEAADVSIRVQSRRVFFFER